MMSLTKPLITELPVSETRKELDIASLIETLADETIRDIQLSYYGNGNLIDMGADKALRKIEGRMLAMKSMVQNLK